MATVFLALGSNVGNSQEHIEKALSLLGDFVSNIVRAPIYTSKAYGVTNQPDFINTALRGETKLIPLELLAVIKDIEQKIGRVQRFRWGPREIDIDIIFYDKMVQTDPNLTIPHAGLRERDFVLKPIADIDPNFIDPVSKLSVQQLLDALPESSLSILKNISHEAHLPIENGVL